MATMQTSQILKFWQFHLNIYNFKFEIILLHYNVLHCQTEFDPSYGNPQ